MIEQIVLEYLAEQMDVPVLMEVPEVPSEDFPVMPERFIVLEKVGGRMTDQIWSASIAVQAYSIISLFDAAELDDAAREVMLNITALTDINGIHIASNYNHTDTRTKRYRYQSVYDLNY